jgi:phage gpG-like protein
MRLSISNTAKNHYVKSFKDQGFTDENYEKWKPRKGEITGFSVSKRSKGSRAILVKSGDLRRSIKKNVNKSILQVTISSDLPYSAVHNYGETINVSSRTGAGTITAKVRGSGKFVDGVFKKGRAKTIKLLGKAYTTGSYTINMPQRQFIGKSEQVDKKAIKIIENRINNLFK